MFDVTKEIKTVDEVKAFFDHIHTVESVNFNPDDTFEDTVNYETGQPTYTKEEAELRDQRMKEAFDVCEKISDDCIYDIALEVCQL